MQLTNENEAIIASGCLVANDTSRTTPYFFRDKRSPVPHAELHVTPPVAIGYFHSRFKKQFKKENPIISGSEKCCTFFKL